MPNRLALATVCAVLLVGCSVTPSLSSPPASSASSPAGTSIASLPPRPASAVLPVRGPAEQLADSIQMIPGPAGGVYVWVRDERTSVLALLDSTGNPGPGWPIALNDTYCFLTAPAVDGSIRVTCASGEGDSRAYAFTPDGNSIAGWPVEMPGQIANASRTVDDVLHVLALALDGSSELRIVAVTPDGTVRTGTPYKPPGFGGETLWTVLGPDGTGYALDFQESPGPPLDTEITAFDLGGVREGWLVGVKGWPSDLAFGPDGRIYVTQTEEGLRLSGVLVFDRNGRPLPVGSDVLPVLTTSTYQGPGPLTGPPPPVVAESGTAFFVSEDGGTTVYGLDSSGHIMAGWPYRDTIGLQWSPDLGDVGGSTSRSRPVVGPGDVLYLLHPPRAATLGGSAVAIGPDGRVREGWPVVLDRAGAVFRSIVVGPDGTAHALAVQPEAVGQYSGTIVSIAPDGSVRYGSTIIEP